MFRPTKISLALMFATLTAVSASAADFEVYGVIDQGLHYTYSDNDGDSTVLDSGITKGSRVGIKGTEDLGNGYSVVFNFETGFEADTGAFDNTKNRLFNRNSYVGLNTPYGEFLFGRTGALGSGVNGSIFLNSFTPFGNLYKECQALQIINHQIMRADNMIRYESPDMYGLQLYAEYSNGTDGDDSVADSKKERFAAVGATYRNGPLRLVFVADNMFYANNGQHYDRDDSQTYNLGLRYEFEEVTLYTAYQYGNNVQKVGNQMTRLSTDDSNNYYYSHDGFDSHSVVLGAVAKVLGGKFKVQAGYTTGDSQRFKESIRKQTREYTDVDAKAWQFAVGYDYPLSKRTYLYAAASYVDRTFEENGVKKYGSKKSDTIASAMLGICHTF